MVLGATGSGKTSACMYPFAEQILAYRARDPEQRIGGLVLEVKGDFCHSVRRLLEKHGRGPDYLEVSLEGELRYNPLHNDLDAYALAYGIASLLNNLFGKGKEPFWQQAYTNLIKFLILLHKVVDGYVTFFDIYRGAIDPDYLEAKIKQGDARDDGGAHGAVVAISFDDFMRVRELEDFAFEPDGDSGRMICPATAGLRPLLDSRGVAYEVVGGADADAAANAGTNVPWSETERAQFEAVKRWFTHDWSRLDARLRTSIVEGISVFLSLFDTDPAAKRVFCPPKECYDRAHNANRRLGRVLPTFGDLIEEGRVCALNFPVSANPGLARVVGTLMKLDYQRAVLNRIPKMERPRDAHHTPWRQTLFVCDEYHAFASVGENDPAGDEKFFALSRQAKCIPVVATHSLSSLRSSLPGESWRTLVQTFRTKVFLATSDDFTAKTASELCGKDDQLKANYTLSETGQDAGISVFTGRAAAQKTSIGTTKGYSVQREYVFEPKVFTELRNAQAVVLAYDGLNPLPPTYCYLKPHYLRPEVSYFEHLAQGAV
jgi:TraM recognition site of TraD and TraG